MDLAHGIVGTHLNSYYWWRGNHLDYDHLLVINSGLQYFTSKLQKYSISYKKISKK
jgi:hypothetical protein